MIKHLCYIALLFLPFISNGQDAHAKKLEKTWKKIHDTHGFRPAKGYKGPPANYYVDPSSINESQPVTVGQGSSTTTPYRGLPYSSRQIQQGRRTPTNPGGGSGGNGTIKRDPSIAPPEPIDFPDVDAPDIDAPDIDAPDISGAFWKYFLIIILLILLALIVYYVLRNRAPRNSNIPFEPLEENMNPAAIPKTELELRLEEAMSREDYRECVRIYFLFAMKELIEKRWIFWKKEKTNIHYIIEMQGKPTAHDFGKVVGIYELVWYGDYHIDRNAYFTMQPTLDAYYKQLEQHK